MSTGMLDNALRALCREVSSMCLQLLRLCLCTAVVPAFLVDFSGEPGNEVEPSISQEDSLPAGSPQGLARALRCRRRVFALERELGVREQAVREREAFEREERRQSEARLMEVNLQLQEKLRARTEEAQRAGQERTEAQRTCDDALSQLGEKTKEITLLKYKLEKGSAAKQETQAREQEHHRAVLRSTVRDNAVCEATRLRAEKLEKCLDGKAVAELLRAAALDVDKAPVHMERIEANFLERFKSGK